MNLDMHFKGARYAFLLGDFEPSQSQKLAHEIRFSFTFINSLPTPSITDMG